MFLNIYIFLSTFPTDRLNLPDLLLLFLQYLLQFHLFTTILSNLFTLTLYQILLLAILFLKLLNIFQLLAHCTLQTLYLRLQLHYFTILLIQHLVLLIDFILDTLPILQLFIKLIVFLF